MTFHTGPLFLIMPFPMLHQVFVLHAPSYECVHPAEISADTLQLNETVWQVREHGKYSELYNIETARILKCH